MKKLFAALAFLLFSWMPAFAVSVLLTWAPSTDNLGGSGVAGYHIYRNGVLVGTSATTTFTDNGVSPTTTYSYAVTAFDVAGNESAQSVPVQVTTLAAGGTTPFTPLHKFFMSPTGNDANSGLDAAHPWATPNHAVVCGDVIIAAAGTYSTGQFATKYQQPTNCPSTTGGIDGTGGIYFAILLCAGPDLMSCNITTTGSGDPPSLVDFNVCCDDITSTPASNWAIEGFNINSTPSTRGVQAGRGCSTSLAHSVHHIAMINMIVSNSRGAWTGMNDCADGQNNPAYGFDYAAAVGVIAQNANQEGNFQSGICVAAIDFVAPNNHDTAAGTHIFGYNNYGMNNRVSSCTALYDGEFIMLDSPDVHQHTTQVVFANNIGYNSTRACIQLTAQGLQDSTMPVKLYNNTCYNNNIDNSGGSADGEFNISGTNTTLHWFITFQNNVILDGRATETGGDLYTAVIGGNTWPNFSEGNSPNQNVLLGLDNNCAFACAPTSAPFSESYPNNNTVATNTQNFFVNPNFTNTTDLLANRLGVPNCAGFTSTTACMGWNANTNTLTTPSVISDLTANCAQCSGKGFQRPSTTCAANADYPTWLKGVVYLQVSGNAIVVANDLVTKPCGL